MPRAGRVQKFWAGRTSSSYSCPEMKRQARLHRRALRHANRQPIPAQNKNLLCRTSRAIGSQPSAALDSRHDIQPEPPPKCVRCNRCKQYGHHTLQCTAPTSDVTRHYDDFCKHYRENQPQYLAYAQRQCREAQLAIQRERGGMF